MSSINEHYSIANATLLAATPIQSTPEEVAAFKQGMADFEKVRQGISPEERQQQIARQNAVEAHTVYRSQGKIVAVHYQDGSTLYPTGGDVGMAGKAKHEAFQMGLRGEAANTYISDQMTTALKARYGAGLEVSTYTAGAAPTAGQLNAKIFGAARANTVNATASLAAFDADLLSMLSSSSTKKAQTDPQVC